MGTGQQASPIRIRGIDYPSPKAAAAALGVTWQYVRAMIAAGKADQIGIGRGAHLTGRPSLRRRQIKIGPLPFASITEAAEILRFPEATLRRWLKKREMEPQLLARAMQISARRDEMVRQARGHSIRYRDNSARSSCHAGG